MDLKDKKAQMNESYAIVIRQLTILAFLCTDEPESAEDKQLLRKVIRALNALK